MVRRTIVSAALALTVSAGLLGARAQEAQTFVVGSHMPLTGALARSGQAFNEGMQVAATMCNAASPRHKIRIDVIDDESTPAKAVSAVEKLSSDGAVAIIGGYFTASVAMRMPQAVIRNGILVWAFCLTGLAFWRYL